MKKQLLYLFLSLSFSQVYSQTFIDKDITYTIDNNVVSATAYSGAGGVISIPDVVNHNGTDYQVTSIGVNAFDNKNITSVTISTNVISIGNYAFYNNRNLTTVTIPDSVITIGEFAFSSSVKFDLSSVTIGKNVTTIGEYAFADAKIETLIIPDNVTIIDDNAFADNNLTNLTLGNALQTIGQSAFKNNQLTSIVIPDNVITIDNHSFEGNPLTTIFIGSGVTSIGSTAFKNNTSPQKVLLTATSVPTFYGNGFNQSSSSKLYVLDNLLSDYQNNNDWNNAFTNILTNKFIENSIEYQMDIFENEASTTITDYFSTAASNLDIPSTVNFDSIEFNVTGIANKAFYSSNITALTIPTSVASIGNYAFFNNDGLTSVTIPDSVVTLGDFAFTGSSNLASVTIGNGLSVVSKYAFSQCKLTSIDIPDNITLIDEYAFIKNPLSEVNFGNSVTTIAKKAFEFCYITSIIFPESLVTIGVNAFGYNAIETISFGSNVQSIGQSAFVSNIPLKEVIITATTPPTIGTFTFSTDASSILYVFDEASKTNYKAATNWDTFFSTIEVGFTAIPDSTFENYLETHDASGNIVSLGDANSMGNGIADDGLVLTSRINSVTSLKIDYDGSGSTDQINDATGIQSFIALETLSLYFQNLSSIDLTKNTALKEIILDFNKFTSIDLSENIALEKISLGNNLFTSLDVSKNVNLKELNFGNSFTHPTGNTLTSIDLSKNVLLESLSCYYNSLETLDLSKNTALTFFSATYNKLTSLDVSKNIALTFINVNNSNLTSLDVSKQTALKTLHVKDNELVSVNVQNGNNTNMNIFIFSENTNLSCIQVDDVDTINSNWAPPSNLLYRLDCSPRTITATPITKVYGATDPALTYTVSPSLETGDTLTGSLTRVVGENVGDYAISSTLSSANYNITFVTANLSITQKAVTVTADAKTKVYGATDPALTYTVSPSLETGDTLTGSLTRVVGENVGDYAISSTLSNANYNITYIPANLSITQKDVTVTADAKTKVYGATDPALTYTVSPSLETGDTLTGSLTRVVGENVGDYAISSTLSNANYNITYVPANLSITQKAVTVTADAKTKVYGATDPALTYTVSPSLETGDTLTGSLTRVVGENVGDYAISSTLSSANYNITFVAANLSIAQKAVTVTADAKTKVYGATDPALTYTITSGSLYNESDLTGSLSREPGEDVGIYTINKGTLSLGDNYTMTYISANFEILNVLNVDNDILNNQIKLYPNPTKNGLNIKNSSSLKVEKIIIYNILGQAIKKEKDIDTFIDMNDFSKGTYIVKILTQKGVLFKKVIKE